MVCVSVPVIEIGHHLTRGQSQGCACGGNGSDSLLAQDVTEIGIRSRIHLVSKGIDNASGLDEFDVVDGDAPVRGLVEIPYREQALVSGIVRALSPFETFADTEPTNHGPGFSGGALDKIDPEDLTGFAEFVEEVDDFGEGGNY